MPVLTEGRRTGAYIISEADGATGGMASREQATIKSGAVLESGTVLGRVMDGARTAVGAAGNPAPAGATITASPAATTAAQLGVHRFRCATTGPTGKWDHFAPGGEKIGVATTGTPYVGGGLTLTISDSGTDPAVGEELTVTVTEAAPSKKYGALSLSATDGLEVAAAILFTPANAADADVRAVVHVRRCEVNDQELVWPEGITADQKAAAIAALEAKGITVR